jgi:hypothetical protein
MSFRYDPNRLCAVNDDTHATLRTSGRFDDIGDLIFSYTSPDLNFDVYASVIKEPKKYLYKGELVDGMITIAVQILEPVVRKAFSAAENAGVKRYDSYQDFKDEISDGMYVLSSGGGEYLKYSPDIRIEFIDRPAQ